MSKKHRIQKSDNETHSVFWKTGVCFWLHKTRHQKMLQVSHGDKPECLYDVSDFPEVADNDMHSAEQINAFLDETMQQTSL